MQTETYNDLLDSDEVHNDDIITLGPAIDAVNFIKVNYTGVARRNLFYLRERIALRKLREAVAAADGTAALRESELKTLRENRP